MSNARADWLVKLLISRAIYLRASVTGEEIIQIIFCGLYYLTVLVYTKTTIHLSVGD